MNFLLINVSTEGNNYADILTILYVENSVDLLDVLSRLNLEFVLFYMSLVWSSSFSFFVPFVFI